MPPATADEIVWIGGDGSARYFQKIGNPTNVWTTSFYQRNDSLYYDGVSTWTKTSAGGVRTKFDATGKHTETIDRFGRITKFRYDGQGALTRVVLPLPAGDSAVYAFTYTSGRLTSVTAPPLGVSTPRVTTITNPAGQITAIQNPGDAPVSFAYLSTTGNSNLIFKRTNRRLVPDSFAYDSGRRIRSSVIKMGGLPASDIVLTLLAGETQGLANSGSPTARDTSKIYTLVNGPQTDVADTTVIFHSRFGPERRIVDAVGSVTAVFIKSCFDWVEYACGYHPMRVQTPLGRTQLLTYDWRGNVTAVIDSVTTVANQTNTTRYEWDQKFDQLARSCRPKRTALCSR